MLPRLLPQPPQAEYRRSRNIRTGHSCRYSSRLAANLRRLRALNGWSQEEYADRAGIHRTYVSDLERAARNPTIQIIEKLAKPFKIKAGELLD